MSMEEGYYLQKAAACWMEGKSLEAGRLLFENLPHNLRPYWARRIIQCVVNKTGVCLPPIEQILQIANQPNRWAEAHDAFSIARTAALEINELPFKSPQQLFLLRHLVLAELVAKIVYNATSPRDEFDADTGWWIAVSVRKIVDAVADEQFSKSMWSELCRRAGDEPSGRTGSGSMRSS